MQHLAQQSLEPRTLSLNLLSEFIPALVNEAEQAKLKLEVIRLIE